MPAEKDTAARLRNDAKTIFDASLVAADPYRAVLSSLIRSGNTLLVKQGGKTIARIDLKQVDRIFLVGTGKATAPMARAVEEILGDRLTEGLISVKTGHGLPLGKTTVLEASHPVPDEAGVDRCAANQATPRRDPARRPRSLPHIRWRLRTASPAGRRHPPRRKNRKSRRCSWPAAPPSMN